MRNGFREGLVTGLKKRVYHGKKAGRRAYWGWRPEGEMLRPQDVRKGLHGNRCIGSEGMKRLGAGGRVSGGWLRQGGSNASGRQRAKSNASRR